MEMQNWVRESKQINFITNVAKRFTISPNPFVEPKCATFKAVTTTKTI
jgi:hypothetical protein